MAPFVQDPDQTLIYSEETFRFLAAPPLWVVALIVLPLSLLFAWWAYSGLQRLEPRTRLMLAAVRWAAVLFVCLLLFQPAWETSISRRTPSQA